MTLIGKILTVFIFFASVLFLGMAVMNYTTQRNYKALVNGVDSQPGLQVQLRETQDKVRSREAKIRELQLRRDLEIAAKRHALAVLEIKARDLQTQLTAVQADYAKLAEDQRLKNELVTNSQERIIELKNEVDATRKRLIDDLADRDVSLDEVTALTDQLNQGEGALRRLRERSGQLTNRLRGG